MKDRVYLCIDLKSFYASVECVERGLDPMSTNLVVADPERHEKTICLAITPAMKALGIRNRCRVFEIPKNVDYIMAPPRMQLYIDYSAEIYGIYLSYVSKTDIHVYSVDEAFLDVTEYLPLYKMSAKQLAKTIMNDILEKTGVRATCGIGTNLYLTKIALDITAKHAEDFIGYLDEDSYRRLLWNHKPLTDFWRIGAGIANRLESNGIYTMGDITRTDEEKLYKLFGVDAELLIDHAWGKEPVTIADIKSYKSKTTGITSGQVLMRNYSFSEGLIILKEMMDLLCLDLVDKNLVTSSVTIYIGYSREYNMKSAKGTAKLKNETNADSKLISAVVKEYERVVDKNVPIRRINICCNNLIDDDFRQYSLFDNVEKLEKNKSVQKTVIDIKKRFGKDAILKGMNYQKSATTRERNHQIGGHKSGK